MWECRRIRENDSARNVVWYEKSLYQQLIGCEDLFRGVIVKGWEMENQSRINFNLYKKH